MTKDEKAARKIKLCVVESRELAVWPSKKGTSESVLYEIKAVDEEGKPWEPKPLRSFAQLEAGVLLTYEVELYKHPKTGDESITLKRPRQNTTARVAYLEKQFEELTDRVAQLEALAAGSSQSGGSGLQELPQGPWGLE